ncbi:MAG: hypothetical protein NVSMB57_07670 [Actinomycetota bacterium]
MYATQMPALIEITPDPESPRRFFVHGDLDIASSVDLETMVATAAYTDGDLQLDLAGVPFMDSTGLSALLRIASKLPNGNLVVENPSKNVARLFEISGLPAEGSKIVVVENPGNRHRDDTDDDSATG